MRKKTKKIYKSILSIIGILALFFLGLTIISFAWDLIEKWGIWILFGSLGMLILLVLLGVVTLKQIKWKIKDIFT